MCVCVCVCVLSNWCFGIRVFALRLVVFLCWCLVFVFCVLLLLCWCFGDGVFVVMFRCWCFCGGGIDGGVFMVVYVKGITTRRPCLKNFGTIRYTTLVCSSFGTQIPKLLNNAALSRTGRQQKQHGVAEVTLHNKSQLAKRRNTINTNLESNEFFRFQHTSLHMPAT